MRVPDGRPEECVWVPGVDDVERPALTAVYLRGDFLEATDSYRFVKVAVTREPDDEEGPIHPDALRLAREHGEFLDCSREHNTPIPGYGAINRPKPDPKEAPTYESLAEKSAYEPTTRIPINARLLLGIAEAFGTDVVILEVPPTTEEMISRALHVVPGDRWTRGDHDDGSEALLMPVAMPRRRDDD